MVFALYNTIYLNRKGLISMIHLHNLINMSIAPPPESYSYKVALNFEEGAEDTFLIQRKVSLYE